MTSDGTHGYTWDARNHLKQIDAGTTANFVYDPFGRCSSKVMSGITTSFLYVPALRARRPSGSVAESTSPKHNKSDVMILLQKQDVIEDLGQVDFDNPEIIVVAKEFSPEQREILSMKSGYLRPFRYLLYDGKLISLEEVVR